MQPRCQSLVDYCSSFGKFRALLMSNPREEKVQVFLVANPVLLAPAAVNITSKLPLGTEYVTDFVIESANRQYMLVEIEAPKHRLYTNEGDPSAAFTHAQRQVEDWLRWVRENLWYARQSMPDIADPEGWVVIGRRLGMSKRDQNALAQKNASLQRIKLLTYDDLLDVAENYLKTLQRLS